VIEPGRVINDIGSLQDFIPTFAAANGEADLVEKVKKGYDIGGKTFKVHLDGFNLMPFLSGKEDKSPRDGFIYWSDDGDCMAVRTGRFKIVFAEQRSKGIDVWREPLSPMRIPKFFDLRADPFERGEESFKYNDWFVENVPLQYAAPALLAKWLESFKEFPPRSKPASFSIDQIMEKLMPKD
jgi:arylsulfatase